MQPAIFALLLGGNFGMVRALCAALGLGRVDSHSISLPPLVAINQEKRALRKLQEAPHEGREKEIRNMNIWIIIACGLVSIVYGA